ncbi:RidA family protein [Rhodococcus sp. ABRD24]|uniref:RidA family protein n=1 Tax=Rhodococcus sp. ABRD24 TaxID=2507582 RepID=UPI001039367F|nr:RidA family protein [Rhodococcus sp. ABRD24]QBJ95578.1 RidA family protein [Rhodococcus sp. ABRD24]
MTNTAITAENLPNAAAEKFRYSFGVQSGSTLRISGQVALKEGAVVGVDDIAVQAHQVFENLKAVVEAAGGSMHDLVETTTYVTDRNHLGAVNDARVEYIDGPVPPTSTLIVVAGLARPEFLVEISAVAELGSN